MNYRDVQAVNGGLDALSESLLRNRMIDEQSRERSAQTGLAQQRLQTDQAFRQAQQQHYNSMESKQSDAAKISQQRAAAEEDQGMLKSVIGANAAGMLDDNAREQVNEWLSEHPRFGKTGIQLSKPKEISPQAGQNAMAQLVQQKALWNQKIHDAGTDEERAEAMANWQLLDQAAQKTVAEKPAKEERPYEVENTDPATGNKTKEKLTPQQWQQRSAKKPLDAQTAAAILKEARGDKDKARALAVQRGYSLTPAPAAAP